MSKSRAIKCWVKDCQGYTTGLAAIIIIVALIMLAGILDFGYAYLRRVRLNTYAAIAARSGTLEISNIIVEAAENRITESGNPSGETEAIKILTPQDREWVLEQAQKDRVENDVLTVIQKNGDVNGKSLPTSSVKINYPRKFVLPCEDYAAGSALPLDLDVIIVETAPNILGGIFFGTTSTVVAGRSTQVVQFCP